MSYFLEAEKFLKRNLKKKKGINTSIIIAFLITGAISVNAEARDVRVRNNIQVSSSQGPNMSLSENATDVVNILNPSHGISHNKYEKFNVGEGNNVIFNNSKENGTSVTGGNVKANPNLKENAGVILNEVKGNSSSDLNGGLEVFGKKADLVVANENGIQVNGARFINTSAVTLSTGKVSVNQDKITMDTAGTSSKIKVAEKGLATDSDYLNFISKSMEINGKVNSKENQKTNINVIAGNNEVSLNKSGSSIKKSGDGAVEEGIAVSASHLGSMYGNNVHIVSTKEGMGVKYDGLISSKENVIINAKGKVSSANLKGKNIELTSTKEVVNTGSIVAAQDVSLRAPVVKNLSSLEGAVRVTETSSGKKLIDRDRGIIYYDHHLTVHNLVDLENQLQLKKASIEAGNDIWINTDMENASFENVGGNLSAGNTIKMKGNVTSKEASREFMIEELLSKIKVDLDWEHRSLVDNAYFNGGNSLKGGSLLQALHMMTDKKYKEFYDALKQVKDPTVTRLLNAYLGSDWKLREKIKEEKDWNKEGGVGYFAGDSSNIKAKNISIEGKSVVLGNKNAKGSDEKIQIQKNELTGHKANVTEITNAKIEADNIVVKAENFENYNADMTGKDYVGISAKKDIVVSGAEVKANTILLEAGEEFALKSQLGYAKDGQQGVTKKAKMEAKEKMGIKAKNMKVEAADILTGNTGTLAVKADKLDVKDMKVLNASYGAEMKEGTGVILKDHNYTKETKAKVESVASVIKGNKVLVDAQKGVNVEGSLVSGIDKNSSILIQSQGDVKIQNAENINYSNSFSDSRGKNSKGVYKLVQVDKKNQENYEVVGSVLKSEGNIEIQSKNMDIISSSIEAKQKVDLAAKENINILSELDKTKEKLMNIQWGSGAIHSHKKESEKWTVVSSTIKAGDDLVLHAKKDINNSSSILEGANVRVKAGEKIKNTAVANTEKSSEEKVAVGVGVNASIGLGGMGASAKVNTLDHSVVTKTSGVDGLLAKDNEFKDASIKVGVNANIKVESTTKDAEVHKNNSIKANTGNVSMESGSTVDLGNTDIVAKKDVNIRGKEVVTNNKTDSKKEVEHKANIGVSAGMNLTNETVSKVNSLANGVATMKDMAEAKNGAVLAKKVVETGKEVKSLVEGIPGIAKQDLAGIKANETFALDYDNTTKKASETGSNTITAGGKATIEGDEVTLTNSHIKAEEANLKAKESIHLAAGEKKEHEEKNGIHVELKALETVGVNLVDGANAKIGLGVKGDYHGSSDIKKESLNTKIEAGTVNKEAKGVKEDDKVKSHYKDNRGLGINTELKIGAASNTVATIDGTVGGNAKYSFDTGKETIKAETGEKDSVHVKAGANVSGSIDTSGKTPNFSVGTDALEYTKNGESVIHVKPSKDLITKDKIDKMVTMVRGTAETKQPEK